MRKPTRWMESPLAGIRHSKSDPVGTQRRLLADLLRRAAKTEWGRRYAFEDLAGSSDVLNAYRQRVPSHDYEAYRTDILRVRSGESDVFWPGSIRHFAVSSGTASEGKLIPVSTEMLEKDRVFSLATALSYMRSVEDASILFGRLLSITGRVEEDVETPGVVVGEISGLLALFSPWYIRRFFEAVSRDILFLPDWDRKLDAIVDRTLSMDIRAIAMVPSWAIVLFPRVVSAYNLRHGADAQSVQDVWPNLKVFFSGGVALSSYRTLLERQIGGPGVDFIESYGASEGFFSFQEHPEDEDMLLRLDNGVYLEFVEVEGNGQRLPVSEVVTGVRYHVHVTTCSGLWCYPIGDIVRFTSLDPYRIVVAGRSNEMIDRYGEAVFGDEAREALEKACLATGAAVRDYHVAPIIATADRLPGHEWLIEFETPPPDPDVFSTEIDLHLQKINRHYVIRREVDAFTRPTISPLRSGTFHQWLNQNRHVVSAQTKVPRMSEGREIAEDVLRISGNNPYS